MNRCWIIAAGALLALSAGAGPAHAHFYLPEHVALVDGWYVRFLGRHVDKAGINQWCCKLAWHHPHGAVMTGILATDEYYQRKGGNPAGFVSGLFEDFYQRSPSSYEVDYWTHRLQVRHKNRQRFVQEFLQITAFENYRPLPHLPMLAPTFPPPGPPPQPRP